MNMEILQSVLGWCSIINVGLLTLWFVIIMVARNQIYSLHSVWYPLQKETFIAVHYAGLVFFKMTIFIFNLVPYFVLLIVNNN